jgi:hypothetical protein
VWQGTCLSSSCFQPCIMSDAGGMALSSEGGASCCPLWAQRRQATQPACQLCCHRRALHPHVPSAVRSHPRSTATHPAPPPSTPPLLGPQSARRDGGAAAGKDWRSYGCGGDPHSRTTHLHDHHGVFDCHSVHDPQQHLHHVLPPVVLIVVKQHIVARRPPKRGLRAAARRGGARWHAPARRRGDWTRQSWEHAAAML